MKKKRHFHSFDALRFLAFFKVFLFHLPIFGFPVFSYLKAGGGVGVMFFFVLSGFLISYIILAEKDRTGRLNLKHFLIRRILRIWPLYYLMIAFAFITPFMLAWLGLGSSEAGYEPNWWYSIGFLENYRMIFLGESPNVAPLGLMWSLCIEEHFYVLWGILFYFLDKKHVPKVVIGSILLALLSRHYFFLASWDSLDLLTNLDLFAIGAIPAYVLCSRKEKKYRLEQKHIRGFALLFVVILLMLVFVYPHWESYAAFLLGPTILGLFFSGLLWLFIWEPSVFKISDGNLLSRWGKYTYGLYVYHIIVIGLLMKLWTRWNWEMESFGAAFFFGLACFGLSLGISILSYRVFELPFLRLKKYFY